MYVSVLGYRLCISGLWLWVYTIYRPVFKRKVLFAPFNCCKNLVFNSRLQNIFYVGLNLTISLVTHQVQLFHHIYNPIWPSIEIEVNGLSLDPVTMWPYRCYRFPDIWLWYHLWFIVDSNPLYQRFHISLHLALVPLVRVIVDFGPLYQRVSTPQIQGPWGHNN